MAQLKFIYIAGYPAKYW